MSETPVFHMAPQKITPDKSLAIPLFSEQKTNWWMRFFAEANFFCKKRLTLMLVETLF
jgi:hypothetical protein